MKLACVFLLSIFISVQAEDLIYSGSLYCQSGDTLEILVEREFGKTFVTSRESWKKWVKRIAELNPGIDLKDLKKDQEIQIQIPKEKKFYKKRKAKSMGELFDPKKNKEDFIQFATEEDDNTSFFATDLNDNSEVNHLFKKMEVKPDFVPEIKYRLGVFYMGSRGTFEETAFNSISITSEQNSPVSFGVSFGKTQELYTYSGSLYFSYLNPGTANGVGTAQEVDIPLEWGGSLYYSNKKNKFFAPFYYGMDVENFSTFNTDELVLGDDLTTRQHTLLYATIGYDYFTKFYNGGLLLKASFARSFFTKANRKSLISDKEFSGYRLIGYANYKPFKGDLFYHMLYKLHTLEGPTQLTISRFGVGVGYSFF